MLSADRLFEFYLKKADFRLETLKSCSDINSARKSVKKGSKEPNWTPKTIFELN